MSSSPPADPTPIRSAPAQVAAPGAGPPARARRPGGLAGWSLRTRLIAVLVAMVAVICALVGIATQAALYRFQVGQLDEQLADAATRSRAVLGLAGPGRPERFRPGREAGPGPALPVQGPGTFVGLVVGGEVTDAQMIGPDGTWRQLPAEQVSALRDLPSDGRPHTRGLGGLGDYRLLATRVPAGDVLVTGLPMSHVYDTRVELIIIEIVLGVGAVALAAGVGAFVVRRTLRPLGRVAATAGRVAELPLDRGEVALSVRVPDSDTDPRTEVGQVGAALNRLLGHVAAALAARQASEVRVRHFVADASHELRTPLAAIRGYAELTRRVADGVPPDVAHAMRRVESEAARMTTLVEDLLLLARLDSGRPLDREPVDLSRLVIDAVSDSRVAGGEHRWRLDLPPESVIVPGDAARLHQVLANLLTNARTHTPPGSTVTTSLTVHSADVVIGVVDDGPGIPAELLPEVFERFARGDTSRSRAAGSTGLGLAIVAAVVEAHGGAVEVTSEPGRTAFTVRLPLHRP